jgi:hypothetical protein
MNAQHQDDTFVQSPPRHSRLSGEWRVGSVVATTQGGTHSHDAALGWHTHGRAAISNPIAVLLFPAGWIGWLPPPPLLSTMPPASTSARSLAHELSAAALSFRAVMFCPSSISSPCAWPPQNSSREVATSWASSSAERSPPATSSATSLCPRHVPASSPTATAVCHTAPPQTNATCGSYGLPALAWSTHHQHAHTYLRLPLRLQPAAPLATLTSVVRGGAGSMSPSSSTGRIAPRAGRAQPPLRAAP